MVTEGKGLKTPIAKLIISVTEVIVIETAASLKVMAILSGTLCFIEVLLQAASITNVSSIPIPTIKNKVLRCILFGSTSFYFALYVIVK